MIRVSDVEIIERIGATRRSTMHRGRRPRDGAPVVLWTLETDGVRVADFIRFKHEVEAIRRADTDGVVKILAVEDSAEGVTLVMEGFAGVELHEILRTRPRLEVGEALDVAARTAAALGSLHLAGVVHGDVRPRSIIIGQDGRLKLTVVGAARAVTREGEAIYDMHVVEELLPYISPEQTGRMNRQVDHRSDLYALGAVLYELLTGRRPFSASDPMDLIHAHLALVPVPPAEVEPGVPAVVSDLVMKLLCKNAEERYCAAEGLLADLEACKSRWAAHGRIDPFPLGQRDRIDLFQIHQKLYGREQDIADLIGAFDDVLRGARQIVLVSGYSGTGKSSLVQEILKPLAREKGYYVSGKYDQHSRDAPYSGLLQAMDTLVKQLLSESDERIRRWRSGLDRALGGNAQVLCEVIPALRHLLGDPPPVPALGPVEAQNRFHLCFRSFVATFARLPHPLALFLDDLQWADPASIELLKAILSDEGMESLFFCGAYRDNEVGPAHPLRRALDELSRGGLTTRRIVLGPLELPHLLDLLRDSLRARGVEPLAELVLRKTGGNPFFVKRFLRHLHDIRALDFDPAAGFRWDLGRIAALEHTDDVASLMAETLRRLPSETQESLTLAAAIGDRFDLDVLSTVSERSPAETYERIEGALREGLVLRAGGAYRFAHDKVQEAAYALIPAERRPVFHHRIGRLLLQRPDLDEQRDLFDIVTHLNSAGDLVAEPREREELARLNLRAAERAEASAAFGAALRFLEHGMALLPEDPWRSAYELTLAYHVRKGVVESLCERHESALETLSAGIENARGRRDETELRRRRLGVQVLRNDLPAALSEGLSALRLFGIDLPPFPGDEALSAELTATLALLEGRPIEAIAELPPLEDPEIAALHDVLQEIFPPCYFLGSNNVGITVMKTLQSTLEHGISQSSVLACVNFGMLLCTVGDIDRGYRFGKLAGRLHELYPDKRSEPMLCTMWGACVQHWKERHGACRETFLKGIHSGVETGQYIWAFYNLVNANTAHLLQGAPLAAVLAESRSYLPLRKLDKFNAITWMSGAVGQICEHLASPEGGAELQGAWVDILAVIEDARRIDNQASLFFASFYRVIHGVLQGRYDAAAAVADTTPLSLSITTWHGYPCYHFYAGIAFARAAASAPSEVAARYLSAAQASAALLERWSRHCEDDLRHRHLLLSAELRRARGEAGADELYDAGIAAAKAARCLQDEALGNELCGRYYLALGRETLSQAYLAKARRLYARWGAVGYAARLERAFPELADSEEHRPGAAVRAGAVGDEPSRGAPRGPGLDALSVLEATQAVSEEIVLPRLLDRLMRIILKNAGARKGFLILKNNGRLSIEAEGRADRDEIEVLRSLPVDVREDLSAHVIHYVARTGDNVVSGDAAKEERFANDPYIARSGARSMLATPILRQGHVAGVIYLENDLATGAFTPERIEVLRTLATQAAISIENATLYARLEEQVAARTAELQSAYAQIVALSRAEKARQEQQMGEKLALIERQEQLIRILSMPILQVWDDVLTIPVVGDLDERRSAQMIEDLLERIVATRSRYAIIDLTGVREVDSATAERLGRVLQAVRLLGAEGVITGIGPAVAQVMTSLGLDLRGVATYGNLREGLRACMLRRAPRER